LYCALRRPRGIPEGLVAVIAVSVLLLVGAVSVSTARTQIEQLGPVVGFLAAILVLADGCDGEGVFRAAGGLLARAAQRSASSLLAVVTVLAAVTTALLSLDTTVVLLTPVVVTTLRAGRVPPRPSLYATAHLANSASLALPVSNLTNLLAFAIVPVSFGRFAALMGLPWLVAIVIETVGVRVVFGADLGTHGEAVQVEDTPVPWFAIAVVALTVIGFGVGSAFGLAPAWVAAGGALVLSARRLAAGRVSVLHVAHSTSPSFCIFVLGLGVVVAAVSVNGFDRLLRDLVPSGSGLPALLGVAVVAAVLSNLVNNLPATLLLLPIVAAGGVAPVLAMLVGVDIGPNLTYTGSLATLLWRDAVSEVDGVPDLRDFSRLALATVPVAVVACTIAVWLAVTVIGTG
jgi:arsenical pump membrane protein